MNKASVKPARIARVGASAVGLEALAIESEKGKGDHGEANAAPGPEGK